MNLRTRFARHYILLFLAFIASTTAFAVQPETIKLSRVLPSSFLGEFLVYSVDSKGELGAGEVSKLSDNSWYSSKQRVPSFGFTNDTYWLSFSVLNDTERQQELFLVIANSLLDSIQINEEVISAIGEITHIQNELGDRFPYSERAIDSTNFVYPLNMGAGERRTILMRVQSTSSVQLPMSIWDRTAYLESQVPHVLFQGVVFGILFAVFLYNIYMYVANRRRLQLSLALLTCSVLFFIMSHEGLGYAYIWSSFSWWNERSIVVFLGFCTTFAAGFFFDFMDAHRRKDEKNKILKVCVGSGMLVAFLGLIIPYGIMIRVACVVFLLTVFAIFYFGISRMLKGKKGAAGRLMSVSWLCVLPFFFIAFVFNKVGLVNQYLVDQHVLLILSAITVMLFTVAVSEKVTRQNQKVIDAQKLAIQHERISRISSQEELNHVKHHYDSDRKVMEANRTLAKQLENRVVIQEKQIEEVSEQLENSAIIDKSTGLFNKETFMSRYQSEWLRSAREKSHLSLLAIELDWSEGIAEQFGEIALQKSILYVGAMLPKFAQRPSDVISRYGGTTFMVLMPSTNSEGAWLVAERIRAGVEKKMIKHESFVFSATVSVGVSSVVPSHHHMEEVLITASQKALYDVQKSGKNSVKLFES